jgi:hypothetical protein
MQWSEIRTRYPAQWLVVEALDARSEGEKRILNQLAVLDSFNDSIEAFRKYQELHRQSPGREFYVFHTSREKLDVTERRWLGVRQ